MRVAMLVTDLELGGTPLRLVALARALRSMGVDIHLGCLAGRGPLHALLEAGNVPTFACDAAHGYDIAALPRLIRILDRIQPDLVHSTLFHANLAARWAAGTLHVPLLTSTATIEIERNWHNVVDQLTRWADSAHLVNSLAVARHVREKLGVPVDRLHVLPPVIHRRFVRRPADEARAQLRLPRSPFVIAWAGRMDPVKRLDVLLACAQHLNRSATQDAQSVCFLLAGDGPLRSDLAQVIEAQELRGTVRLLGWQSDLGALFSAADALLFPSQTEGMPNTLLEAMHFGVPIVASDIPSHRELCGDPPRFLLAPVGNVAATSAALVHLRMDPLLRQRLATRAQEATAPMTLAAGATSLMDVYRRVLAGKRSTRCPALEC